MTNNERQNPSPALKAIRRNKDKAIRPVKDKAIAPSQAKGN